MRGKRRDDEDVWKSEFLFPSLESPGLSIFNAPAD